MKTGYDNLPFGDMMKRILLGTAVDDALGYTHQFLTRQQVRQQPIKGISSGRWSDDTSLSLCLADSLCGGYDLNDIARKFLAWYEEGFWTPYGHAFDVGKTTLYAIVRLRRGIAPAEAGMDGPKDNGNGSLMRIAPLIPFAYGLEGKQQNRLITEVSSITHRHPRAILACIFYCKIAFRYLDCKDLKTAFTKNQEEMRQLLQQIPFREEAEHFERLLKLDYEGFKNLKDEEIRSFGYVMDTLEASLWSVFGHHNFEDSVLCAVNLGYDTDTVGAITGALAGIIYGCEAIPKEWITALDRVEDIIALADRYDAM